MDLTEQLCTGAWEVEASQGEDVPFVTGGWWAAGFFVSWCNGSGLPFL